LTKIVIYLAAFKEIFVTLKSKKKK